MRALTVRQPWAGLIAHGIKNVENRTWAPTRGLYIGDRFAIHAGRWDDALNIIEHGAHHDIDFDALREHRDYQSGVIVCTVRLVDVRRDSASSWAVPGAWHWILDRPRRVRSDRPRVRGSRGLWIADDPHR